MYAHYKPLTMQCLLNNDMSISTNDNDLHRAYVLLLYALVLMSLTIVCIGLMCYYYYYYMLMSCSGIPKGYPHAHPHLPKVN